MKNFKKPVFILLFLFLLLPLEAHSGRNCPCPSTESLTEWWSESTSPKPEIETPSESVLNSSEISNISKITGDAFEIEGLIWSGVHPAGRVTLATARRFCAQLDARLPQSNDFKKLRRALGYRSFWGYQPDAIRDMGAKRYWTDTSYEEEPNLHFIFNSYDGDLNIAHRFDITWFRCVLSNPH